MPDHPCPFTAGELLALAAIAEVRAQQSSVSPKLADLCAEHAKLHQTETQEEA